MTTAKQNLARIDSPSLDLQSLFGPPPLVEGEDRAAYDALSARIRSAVGPQNIFEEIWVRDIADNLWETLRLRRMKAHMIQSSAVDGLKELWAKLEGGHAFDYRAQASKWARGVGDTVKYVKILLTDAGLTHDAIVAQTFVAHLEKIERIDKLIMQSEARRNVILREIDRHRDVVARRLREAAVEIEEADFKAIAFDAAAQ